MYLGTWITRDGHQATVKHFITEPYGPMISIGFVMLNNTPMYCEWNEFGNAENESFNLHQKIKGAEIYSPSGS